VDGKDLSRIFQFPQHLSYQSEERNETMPSIAEDKLEAVQAEAVDTENATELPSLDAVAEKKLVRKIDLYLMPSIFVLYLLSYVVG
jgi:hypothetical protein